LLEFDQSIIEFGSGIKAIEKNEFGFRRGDSVNRVRGARVVSHYLNLVALAEQADKSFTQQAIFGN
jgi:hypothetical protein